MSKKATLEEMEKEALVRLKLLKMPKEQLKEIRKEGKIKVTNFSSEFGDVEAIHEKALKAFRKSVAKKSYPFYITESWHGVDIISILVVESDKDDWEMSRQMAGQGYHRIFAYNSSCEGLSEVGNGLFSIEDGVLWRVG